MDTYEQEQADRAAYEKFVVPVDPAWEVRDNDGQVVAEAADEASADYAAKYMIEHGEQDGDLGVYAPDGELYGVWRRTTLGAL